MDRWQTLLRPWSRMLAASWQGPARLLAVLLAFLAVNALSFRHYGRWDLTANRRFTLAPVTRGFLKEFRPEVDVIGLFLAGSPVEADLRTLVDEYRKAAGKKLRVEWIDPARQPDRAEEIKAKHRITLRGSSLLVARGDRRRLLREEDLVLRDASGLADKFNGEIALTAALVEVMEEGPRKLGVVTGHSPVADLQASAEEMQVPGARQNLVVEFVSLSPGPVPEDVDVLVLAAPQTDLSAAEVAELERFWARGRASVFLALDPDRPVPRLKAFVRALGAAPRGDRLVHLRPNRGGPGETVFAVQAAMRPGSPVTREFEGMSLMLGARTESLELFPDADLIRARNIHLTPLLVADPVYWGETEPDTSPVRRDRTADHHAPLYVAASVEQGAVENPNLRVDTQRLVVVSNPTILRGGLDRNPTQSDFVMACVNWLLDRSSLIGITPKEPTRHAVALSPEAKSRLERWLLWIGPGLAAAAAGWVGWRRRL